MIRSLLSPIRNVREESIVINRKEVIKLLLLYMPEADEKTLNRMAEDVIIDVIPALYTAVQKVTSNEKKECFFRKI